jgi:opacity protein-like surface antigen
LGLRYEFSDSLFLGGDYRFIDVSDDAPYRGDLTGDISIYSLSLGWMF